MNYLLCTYNELLDAGEFVEPEVRDVMFDFVAVQVCGVDLLYSSAADQRNTLVTRAFGHKNHRVLLFFDLCAPADWRETKGDTNQYELIWTFEWPDIQSSAQIVSAFKPSTSPAWADELLLFFWRLCSFPRVTWMWARSAPHGACICTSCSVSPLACDPSEDTLRTVSPLGRRCTHSPQGKADLCHHIVTRGSLRRKSERCF